MSDRASVLVDLVAGAGDLETAAAALEELVRWEDDQVLANLLQAYEDPLPKVLQMGPASRVAAVLAGVPTAVAKRALFGSYARIPDHRLRTVLALMPPGGAAALIDAMAVGIDAPREMARVLAAADGGCSAAVALAHPAAVLRLLDELAPAQQHRLLSVAGAVAVQRIDDLLATRDEHRRRRWLGAMAAGDAGGGTDRVVDLTLLQSGPSALAASHLAEVPSSRVREVLRALTSERAASLLTSLARVDVQAAAEQLEAADRRLLLRRPAAGAPVAEWLHESRSAAVIGALDPHDPSTPRLLGAIRTEHLEMLLPHVPWERRAPIEERLGASGALPLGIEVLGVSSGRRRSRPLDVGRWVRIEEELDAGALRQPIVVDLLELPLGDVRLEAVMAVDDRTALPVRDLADVFEVHRRSGTRPSAGDFSRFGLVQLSKEVLRTGAVAAINGNFYFDYGHYVNGTTLGIDVVNVPGLFFGDPIGWFVAGGVELSPPSFNRAAAVVTADGELHVDRVMMDRIEILGRTLTWDLTNVPKASGGTILYTSLYGYRTEASASHVDVACARGQVWDVAVDGAQVIPLTGFVLSIPTEVAEALLAGVGRGTAVRSSSPLERRSGPVSQAMACGPLLVRDGGADLDFMVEDFGQQDSSVMPFFLPRTVETYRAARSFLGTRGRTLVLGSVSGTAYGFGAVTTSAGTTFGELAQLCVDLGLDTAYALDGGGSSSVVGLRGGRPTVLNSPTGGTDVAAGQERFINTYWLVHPRQELP